MSTVFFSEPLTKGQLAYERIAELQNQITSSPDNEIQVSISLMEHRTGLPFIFLLGCLPYCARAVKREMTARVDSKSFKLMKQIGVPGTGRYGEKTIAGTTGFRQLTTPDEVNALANTILQGFPTQTSELLKGALEFNIGEVFNNAREHSGAEFILGGWFTKAKGIYCFSCYDTGIGIPEKVNRFREENNYERIPPRAALRWAMKRGSSTSSRTNPGLGLDLMKEFVKLNGGALRICTGDVLYILNNSGEKYILLNKTFFGTVFEMDIKPDSRLYRFAQEGS